MTVLKSFLGKPNLTRGVRNNNVFNIRINDGNKWLGKIPREQNTDKAFEQFTHFEYGIRAFIILMRNYMTGSGSGLPVNTITGIVNRFAPSFENNTSAYIAKIVADTGYTANQALAFNEATIRKLAKPMAKIESAYTLTDIEFSVGWSLLGSSSVPTTTPPIVPEPDFIVAEKPRIETPKTQTANVGGWIGGGLLLLIVGGAILKTK